MGCRFNKLYVIGIMATTPCGGAVKLSRERRLRKLATSVAGRWVDERKVSVRRRKRAR